VDANVTFGGSANGPSGGASGTAYVRANAGLPTDINTAYYLEFTLTAAAGHVLNLNSLSFDMGGSTQLTSGVTFSSQLRSNAEAVDYATPITLNPGASTTVTKTVTAETSGVTKHDYGVFTADLSGEQYQNMTSITFRLYCGKSVTTGNSTTFFRFDNIVLDGAVAVAAPVPEPATVGLLAGAALFVMTFLTRRFSRRR
jgi:hypothetical protein